MEHGNRTLPCVTYRNCAGVGDDCSADVLLLLVAPTSRFATRTLFLVHAIMICVRHHDSMHRNSIFGDGLVCRFRMFERTVFSDRRRRRHIHHEQQFVERR